MEAIDLLEPLNNQRALGIVYSNLALQEASTNQLEAGIHHFKQALDLHRAVGDEQGLANTYSQLGKTFFLAGEFRQAEKCLNNASEHFIKLGSQPGESAALRLLAKLYQRTGDPISAARCLERTIQIDLRYRLPELKEDQEQLLILKQQLNPPRGAKGHPSGKADSTPKTSP